MNLEQHMEARLNRRFAAEDRYLGRLERRTLQSEALIGELCVEGKTVYYINLLNKDGRYTGKIKQGGWGELIVYLIRNNYV